MSSELSFSGGGLTAPLTIKASSRAKRMRLKVDPRTGSVVLTLPRRASQTKAIAWAAGHRDWVEAALADVPAPVRLGPGVEVPLYGIPHYVDWSEERPRTIRLEGERLMLGGPAETVEARLLRWLKAEARAVLTSETEEYATAAGVAVHRVGIGDPRSRWGSCSSSGTIRYSWRLILAPEHVRRATVAHEVAHRIHMNHGREFHALVRSLFGADPEPARRWLRHEGASLHRFGRL